MKYYLFLFVLNLTLFSFVNAQAGDIPIDKIIGKWCFKYIEVSTDKEPENRNYEFRKDGACLYQNSSFSDNMKNCKWNIKDNKLRLKPEFISDLEVLSLTDREMVLKFLGKLHFLRGSCE